MSIFVGNGTTGVEARANRLGLPTGTTDPATANAGDTYYKTDTNKIRVYNGTVWADLASGGGSGVVNYQIERSLRFNSADSAYLSRTPAVAGNRRTWTVSCWVKRAVLGSFQYIFEGGSPDTTTTRFALRFNSSDTINVLHANTLRTTTQVFRDTSAWYHIVVAVDTPQVTAANRLRLYINGTEVTTFSSSLDLNQNADTGWNMSAAHSLGTTHSDGGNYLSAYLADFHSIDGQALAPTAFTEVSPTTGQLIPLAYAGPYGTNGFWLKFSDNSAATAATLGKDYSGNNNDWTPNNLAIWNGGAAMYSVRSLTNNLGYIFTTSGYLPAASFDGSLLTYAGNNNGGGTNTWTAPVSITVNTSLRVYVGSGAFPASTTWAVNGTSQGSTTNGAWLTASVSTPYTLTSVANTLGNSSTGAFFAAIEVDGVILVDKTNATNDSLIDTPTSYGTDTSGVGGVVRGNYCTLNPLAANTATLPTNGNLEYGNNASFDSAVVGTIGVSSGKWYWEFTAASTYASVGFTTLSRLPANIQPTTAGSQALVYIGNSGQKSSNGIGSAYGAVFVNGDVIGVALDLDAGTLSFYRNGVGQGTAFSSVTGTYLPVVGCPNGWDCGTVNFGQRAFAYTAPSGFKALCDTNLPAPSIAKPNTVMDVKLWTGTGATQSITGVGFNPDFLWIKSRNGSGYGHHVYDSVRGIDKFLRTNTVQSEFTISPLDQVTSLNADGFTLGSDSASTGAFEVNEPNKTYVGWLWDAGTTTASNGSGSITSQVRANVSAGFSIVSYTGTGSTGTLGHGLGVKPQLLIVKSRTQARDWLVYHTSYGATQYTTLNGTGAAAATTSAWNNTEPTSTVFTIGNAAEINTNGSTNIAYCFSPVVGYSAMGSYVGNGSSEGPFIFTSFRPRWVMYKVYSGDTGHWFIHDTSRDPYNEAKYFLRANLNTEETTSIFYPLDILSNGFKIRSNNGNINGSGFGFIYYAVAENPFQYARAR